MSDPPASTYLIGGAAMPTVSTPAFKYNPARKFQHKALEWIHDDDREPVSVLTAPTGGGKTAVIAALADASEQTLCVYPTNALVNAQTAALEQEGLEVIRVTSETLEGTGDERAQHLLSIAQRGQRGNHDVMVTNPDILQAIIQDMYFSPGDRILQFYSLFDAAVFDEFHYYDELSASGLLMQIKVLSERGSYIDPGDLGKRKFPQILLSSATPDNSFIEHITDDLNLTVRHVTGTVQACDLQTSSDAPSAKSDLLYNSSEKTPNKIDIDGIDPASTALDEVKKTVDPSQRFRFPMRVNRWDQYIMDDLNAVVQRLRETVEDAYEGGEPVAAIIFNSAARSNEFQQYLYETDQWLYEQTAKDNGYDTGADRSLPDEFAVLNTTSKGEVGLDFDIKRLVMVRPFTGTAFIQRIGRAGRQSPATVDVYGLDDPNWPPVQSYPDFLRRVLDVHSDSALNRERLREVIGLRAARALRSRFEGDRYANDDIWDDFGDLPRQSHWRSFLDAVEDAIDHMNESVLPPFDRAGKRTLHAIQEAVKGLDSLRGRTISHPVTYPLGDGSDQTEYDLLRALQHYTIDTISHDQRLHLKDTDETGSLRGIYCGFPQDGDGIDLTRTEWQIEKQLQEGYLQQASGADLSEADVSSGMLQRFFDVLPLSAALVPEKIQTSQYLITCNTEYGGVKAIDDQHST
ncbi:type I-D CRISPR-associated helicase Cas3' [Salinarchaeum sp. IM2453]|uniref:type I-D CRISPR-associated helicase Cas3' n=1 Tax=Salinarchaeum sp. IM2453 TaxID=2862870 RepID=UPI001C83D748|nr:type I-D CRISPR-associated helicase Cas3' [Salinarchaeum sp. IM2453]QZA89525.1 type I-D CRISPR-associated helicase Cas3' [Salinarchaeum sp. IM2453]